MSRGSAFDVELQDIVFASCGVDFVSDKLGVLFNERLVEIVGMFDVPEALEGGSNVEYV
jgi:hypothetical protein